MKRAAVVSLLLLSPAVLPHAGAQEQDQAEPPATVPAPAVPDQPEEDESLLAPGQEGSDMVDRIVFRDETTDQVLALLERLTGRSIIRPQALPAATFTFNSQKPMTREEAILALESMLSINGIGVTPLGELFLKVVPLARLRSEAPEFLTQSTLNLPPSGRVVSRMLYLDFLSLEEIQTQLNLMITSGSGSIIPFPKANGMLITDTVSNLQAIEELLKEVDRPFERQTVTRFFAIQHGRAEEIVAQLETLAGTAGVPELSSRTILTADERSNQIILVADEGQVDIFTDLIEKLDVPALLVTNNEVIFLKHANAVEVASLLSQLAGGRSGGSSIGAGGSGSAGGGSRLGAGRTGGGRSGGMSSGTNRRGGSNNTRTNRGGGGGGQRTPQVPQLPGVRAQQVEAPAPSAPSPAEAGGALDGITSSVGESDFSENLTILADERTNAIIVSGTRQDITLLTELIEKIDIILAQVRIEVFIAEVSLSGSDNRGIDFFELEYAEASGDLSFTGSLGDVYRFSRTADRVWEAVFNIASRSSDVEILSTPTLVTTHNKEARFLVGESRPIVTGTLTSGIQNDAIRTQVQQQDIAIELTVLPLIGNDGTIQLEILQTVDDVGEEEVLVDGNPQPVIIRREAESFVSVADGEVIVLGGLQRSRKSNSEGRMAFFGSLPLIGDLFTSRSKSNERTELLLFIRPTILATTQEANADGRKMINRQTREADIRHALDPENYPDPDSPGLSPEARELRRRGGQRRMEELRKQRETEPWFEGTVPDGAEEAAPEADGAGTDPEG